MAMQLTGRMRPYLDDIVKTIKDHLRQRGRKNAPLEGPIFQCLAMLTTAVGPMLTSSMHEVLDIMFPWGISDALYHALTTIANHIPPLLPTIQSQSFPCGVGPS
jgi:FKBP12-rapamycin complex-associated protein